MNKFLIKCEKCNEKYEVFSSVRRKKCTCGNIIFVKKEKLIKFCQFCGKEFKSNKQSSKFCSKSCKMKYSHKNGNRVKSYEKCSNSLTGKYKSPTKTIYCLTCGKEIIVKENSIKKFCNQECFMLYYKNKINKNAGKFERTKETRDKNSKALKERWKDKEYKKKTGESISKALTGKSLSEQHKLDIGSSNKGNKNALGHKNSLKQRKNISDGVANALLNGKMKSYSYGKFGYFWSIKNNKNLYYRSLWELNEYKKLENNKTVKFYFIETIKIPYKFEGYIHNYIPDILIEYVNGTKELREVKPKAKFKNKNSKEFFKIKAGKKYAKLNNINFTVVDKFVKAIT